MIDRRRLAPLGSIASLVVLLVALFVADMLGAQEVTLPLDRYEELRRQARGEEGAPPREAVRPIVLESCRLAIDVGATSARLVEIWAVTLFGDGWRSLALPGDRALVESSFGAFEGALAGGAEPTLQLRGEGRSAVRLVSVVPLAVDESATRLVERLTLELPEAAAITGELVVPPTIEKVEGTGALAVWKSGDRWRFAGEPGRRIELTLVGPSAQRERAEETLRFTSRVASVLAPGRTRFGVASFVTATVVAGRLDELRLELPPGFAVVEVKGALASWRVEEGTLVAVPLASVESELTLEVELAGPPAASFSAPLVAVVGSERESRLVRAAAEADALLRLVEVGGARLAEIADAAALPARFAAAKGPILALDPGARSPSWELVWPDGAELLSAQVDRLLYEVAAGRSGRAFVRAWLVVRNSGLDRLGVEMPVGFELAEAERDGEPFVPGREAGALVAPLAGSSAPQLLCLRGFVPLAFDDRTERIELALPAASVPIGRIEVRFVSPGSESFGPLDPAREGDAGAPPTVAPATSPSHSAPLWAPAQRRIALSAFELPRSIGLVESTAAWSALTARPAALVLVRSREKEERSWF